MSQPLPGLHHLTAICGDPQRNVDFYAGVLGLRLVKKTVNFDDPGTYHLYYGDGRGTPGTLMTFFSWTGARRGRRGQGQVTATALTVPESSLDYWRGRLSGHGISLETLQTRFGLPVLRFEDPDGLALELTARPEADRERDGHWADSPVPVEHAIRRLDGVTMTVAKREPTEAMLITLGFTRIGEDNGRIRFSTSRGESSTIADLVIHADAPRPNLGVGIVHHVAWRTPNDETQRNWRKLLTHQGRSVSPVMDRDYFHSIYFSEPGGVLFEIATDPPGFTVDEPLDELGTHLCLPKTLEDSRPLLEEALLPLHFPVSGENEKK